MFLVSFGTSQHYANLHNFRVQTSIKKISRKIPYILAEFFWEISWRFWTPKFCKFAYYCALLWKISDSDKICIKYNKAADLLKKITTTVIQVYWKNEILCLIHFLQYALMQRFPEMISYQDQFLRCPNAPNKDFEGIGLVCRRWWSLLFLTLIWFSYS